MTVSSPADCSLDTLASSIFRIDVTNNGQTFSGSGFTVALFQKTRRLVLATAKHVLARPDDDKADIWKVQQFDRNGAAFREIAFLAKPVNSEVSPIFTHPNRDLGVLVLPEFGDNGHRFGHESETLPCVIDLTSGVAAGTRVAWAGFPRVIEQTLGFPQLCYFEGVVSAMIDHGDKQLYIVDGHAAHGVSGGPVWHWSHERRRIEIVGVVSAYHALNNGIPGFCVFEPINPILYFLETDRWHPDLVSDHLLTNRSA